MKNKFYAYLMIFVMLISMVGVMPAANASGVIYTVFKDGAYGSGYEWSTERTELTDGRLKLSTGNYYQPSYVKTDTYLPVTAETRDEYALRFKIYDAKMAGTSSKYAVYLTAEYTRASDSKKLVMYVEPKVGWQNLVKDTGKDYQEVIIPLSEFKDKGRIAYSGDTTLEQDPHGGTDSSFRLATVDWSKLCVGVGIEGIAYTVGYEEYGTYLHYGYVTLDDVEFVKLYDPDVKAYAVDENENPVGTESPLTVPANVGIMAEFDSDFLQTDAEIMEKLELQDSNGGNVEIDVKKSESKKRGFVVTPKDNLTPDERYSLIINDGLVDIANKTLGEKTIEFTADDAIVYLPDPVSPEVTETTKDTATISWQAPVWEDGEIEGYKIYRDGIEVSATSGTSFTDTDLVPNKTYSYKIVAYSGEYLSKSEAALTVTTEVYAAPENFVAAYTGSNEIWLRWDADEDCLGYVLTVGTAETELTDNEYLITNLEPNQAVNLKLKAKNKNAKDTEYYSEEETLSVTTKNTEESPIHTLVNYGGSGTGVTTSGWGNPEYSFSGKAGIDSDYSAMSIHTIGGGGCGLNIIADRAIPLSDGTGVWMYVKTEEGKAATSMKLAVKGNSTEPTVIFDVNSPVWTPIYIPFSEYTRLGLNVASSMYMYFTGNGAGDHYLCVDGMMVAADAPQVTDVYLSEDGVEKASPYPENATELNIRFSAPIDEESLENIEVYINDEKQSDVSFAYSKSKLTATAKFNKDWPEQAEIRVVVPTTVKAVDHYTIEGETGVVSSTTITTGAALEELFETTLAIRENPIQVSAETVKNNGTANGSATISNTGGESVSVTVYTVVYNKTADGVVRYKGLVSESTEIAAGATNVVIETPDITYGSEDTVETYVWNKDMLSVVNR